MQKLKNLIYVAAVLGGWALAQAAESQPLFRTDFNQAEVGKVPDGMLVLDGGFAVREEGTNRFLELPDAPLDTFGLLFGPAEQENLSVTARVFSTGKGRRFPTFAVGVGGVGGYRLQVSPGKKELELYKGDIDKASVPFEWTSGDWCWLKLQVRKVKEGEWQVAGKAWKAGTAEPPNWTITWTETDPPKAGRASCWGCPFAGTPIRFDDLAMERTP